MVFIFDENFSYRLADGINALEEGNKSHGSPSKVYHIKRLGQELEILPSNGKAYSDEEVIEIAGKVGGIIITQDDDFKKIKHYHQLYKEHNVGVIFFKAGKATRGYWNLVTHIITHWNSMKEKIDGQNPPFAFQVSSNGIQAMNF